MNLLKSIERNEGFKNAPYIDPLAKYRIPPDEYEIIVKNWNIIKPTFGFGATYIEREAAKLDLEIKIAKLKDELSDKISFFYSLPEELQDVLIEMAYQMGISGLLNFKKMLGALSTKDYNKAADEMLDSRWAKQTERRANYLAYIVRSYKDE